MPTEPRVLPAIEPTGAALTLRPPPVARRFVAVAPGVGVEVRASASTPDGAFAALIAALDGGHHAT